jgi:hypothetical protein
MKFTNCLDLGYDFDLISCTIIQVFLVSTSVRFFLYLSSTTSTQATSSTTSDSESSVLVLVSLYY